MPFALFAKVLPRYSSVDFPASCVLFIFANTKPSEQKCQLNRAIVRVSMFYFPCNGLDKA